MAEVGEVRARVTAETAQFRTAMAGASASMKQIRADVRAATIDFRAGKIGQQDYATAVRFAQTQVRELRKEQLLLRGSGLAAARGLGTVRSSMASLAAMSIGVKGTLGTLTSALLFMSVGNLAAIGVIAGIAAVVKGYQVLRERAEEAGKAAKEAAQKIREAWLNLPGPALELARVNLSAAQARFDAAEAVQFPLGKESGFRVALPPEAAEELRNARRALEVAQAEFDKLNKPVLEQARAQQELAIQLRATAAGYVAVVQAASRWRQSDAFADFRPLGYRYNRGLGTRLGGPAGGGITDEDRANAVRGITALQELASGVKSELLEKRREMSEVGELWARSILTSMLRAFRSGDIGKAFANVLGTLLEQIIVGAIIKGLRGAKGGFFGFLGGLLSFQSGGVVPGAKGEPQLAVVHGGETVMPTHNAGGVFTVAVPRLMGPAIINDAEWQRIWRDTALAAQRQGFRMQVV